ncbi:hypothetical protein [Brevundimonas sp. A19_0]|uniref:hypothetical protein n=1 Tax=Brevundimonas sp. A19_0 TaxID=2821087 RepID=UPI001ADAFBFD|nr:hypothetical protein [Brevundimonas sp. A19_0]MBO9500228.1 hypothetical protein [Brevundimonas sp. A19_0]
MTLFGQTLGVQEVASLTLLLATLIYWLFVLRGARDYRRWFKQWEADRKARREAQQRAEGGGSGGPWG